MQVLGQADFVVEAINECETSKKAAFLLLDRVSLRILCILESTHPTIPAVCMSRLIFST